jgi:hypothetical protein
LAAEACLRGDPLILWFDSLTFIFFTDGDFRTLSSQCLPLSTLAGHVLVRFVAKQRRSPATLAMAQNSTTVRRAPVMGFHRAL